MNTADIQTMGSAVANWLDSQQLESFYEGVRTHCALALGVAPNNRRFHAAWDRIEVWTSGPGTLRAVWGG